uniref:Sperm microtubule inner protein 2 n=1 Tax=Ovis aries TaxID=9940 RepID=A0AC11D0T6_SHEEP
DGARRRASCTGGQAGPDYVKDHLPQVAQHTAYIGEKRPAIEKTGDLRYLWRPASNRSLPAKYKPEYVGEIGWGIPEYDFINKTRLQTGFHIKYGELSQAATDKLSHRYQCPWQPNPSIMDTEGSSSRGFIAWHMGDYEDTSQRNSKRAVLLRQSKAALPIGSRPPKPPKLPKLPKKEEVRILMEREMATHSSTLAWRIPWIGGAWWAIVHRIAKSWPQL